VTRSRLLLLVLVGLALVLLAWLHRSGLWRRHRLAILGGGVALGLLAAARRLGVGELLLLAAVGFVAWRLLPAPRPPT
jgi:hypothetical protein